MDIKPIRNDDDLERAMDRLKELLSRDDQASDDEGEILADLIQAYEERHYPIEPVSAADAFKFALDQRPNGPCRAELPHARACGPVEGRDDACACGCSADDHWCVKSALLELAIVVEGVLALHWRFPPRGSNRARAMNESQDASEWCECDCDLCVAGRAALAGWKAWRQW